ncbi:spermatogenesis-associated protein 31E1-like [Chionomys nivalis]|uniref:spermatogenesis-associated protein 31E1-like n=1 Tax=Chionomys nivalis TaxID=269649 RepID=UPI0025971753|nr:spermatogenesis-associated protein 31E1-like [Chionomys nivalis]
MENSLFQLSSISDYWMSLSSIVMEMSFGVMCGAGLFLLLIPFLKEYPASPPPGSRKNPPKVVRRGQSRTRKKIVSAKGGRDGRKNVEETQNASRHVEIPIKDPLLDSMPFPPWTADKKLDQLPLSQLLSYLKILENLIQQRFSQVFWGMSSMLSESVVASAWVSRSSSSTATRTSSLCNTYGPFPALPMAQGLPPISQTQPVPHQLVTSSLVGVTQVQTLGNLPSSTPNQTPFSSKSSPYGTTCRNTGVKASVSLLTENQSWQQGLEWEDTIDSNVQNQQAGFSWPTHNSPGGTLPAEAVRSASILPEHCQFLQHHEETQSEDKVTELRENQGSYFRILSSLELTQLWGHFPANSPCQPKNKPELPKPAQPSILDSKSCKLSQMMGSVPSAMPLKKLAICNIHDPIKKGPGLRANNLPCTSSSSPGKGLEPRKPALRTDQQSYVNTAQDLSFLDPKTQMKLELNIMQLPMKRRRPSTSVSKSEYCPKAAVILEKLHHQDPGGTRVKTLSAASLQSPLFSYSPSEVAVMQRVTPSAASHGPSKAHPATKYNNLSTRAHAYCLLAKTQQSRTVRGTGRGSLQPRTSLRTDRHEPWKMFKNVTSRRSCVSGKMVDPEVRIPSLVVKQTSRIAEVKKETHPPWKVTLGSRKIPNGQNINTNPIEFKSVAANRNPGYFQPSPQHSRGPALQSQMFNEVDFKSNKQPQPWPTGFLLDCQSAVCPFSVSSSSGHSLPSFQNRSKNPKTSQGLGDLFPRKDHSQETQKLRVSKDKIPASNHKIFHSSEERKDVMRSRAKSQGEKLGRMGLSQASGLIQLEDTDITEHRPSFDVPGKEQAPAGSFLKKIVRNILQYLNLSTKDKEQGGSLKNESPPPSPIQTQEVAISEKLIYNMAAEAQSLMDVVVQILVDRLGLDLEDPSKVQWYRVGPMTSQLGVSSHSSEDLYATRKSRPVRRMSRGPHTSPKSHNHSFTHRGIGDKQQPSVDAQKACDQHQNRVKREMGFDPLLTLKGKTQPFPYRTGDKQQSGTAIKTAHDPYPYQIKVKSEMGHRPSKSRKGHNHPSLHRETGTKQQLGVIHRTCGPHQRTKKGMGYGHLNSFKNNYLVTHRGTGDKEQSCVPTQGAGHPK